jgi:hypothetical protein
LLDEERRETTVCFQIAKVQGTFKVLSIFLLLKIFKNISLDAELNVQAHR